MKPHAPACDRNREPIIEVLRETFADSSQVLEIGSGTGQHAVYFAPNLAHLTWHTSDLPENHMGIRLWLEESGLDNVAGPHLLDVGADHWSDLPQVDAVFTANSLHIMSWPHATQMLAGVGRILPSGGTFCVYGPFNYEGAFTSESNARFEQWLKGRDPLSGIRDFEAICEHADQAGMNLVQDFEMPANNRLLHFRKS